VDLSFFDCNCMIGKRADRREGEPWSLESLLAEMDACGISEALVTHALSRDYDPAAGNQEISRLVAGSRVLHGCWAILPPSSREIPAPDAFLREMLAKDVVAAIAYPHSHNFSLSGWSVGPLLSALEHFRIPLAVPFGQADWEEIERLCGEHTSLPVIVTGLNYRQLRFLLPLWERYRNLFVDLSWFSIHDGLAYLAERGVLRQVLFGTNYPLYEPGAAVTMVTYANLQDEERRMVAGGTLREIIRGIRRNQP
jgi:predicted TIM-barrel fold metal-dependent hydrolase